MSLRIRFLHSHLNFFPENLSEIGDEQNKLFQDIKSMEHHYQGFWNDYVMEDYCLMLHCDAPDIAYRRQRMS
jgi:hypothetical protein